MTVEQYQAKLKELIGAASQASVEKIIVPAASELLAKIKNRVFLDGKNSNGGSIGVYSTRPMYASRKQFVKKGSFKAQGKINKSPKFNNGKARRSMFLPEGYKGLRAVQGMDAGKVNLFYSGDLNLSYVMSVKQNGAVLGLNKESQKKKRIGLEKKYGKTLPATTNEMDAYKKDVSKEIELLTKKILTP